MYDFSEYTQKVYVREQYYNEEIFPEGMKVRNGNDRVGTIIRRGPNYVICLDENHKTFRSWISDISEVHELGTDETREYLQDLTPGQKKEKYAKNKTPEWSTSINKRKSTQKEMYKDSYSESLIKRTASGISGGECYGEVDNKQEVSDEFSSSLMDATISNLSRGGMFEGSMKQARKNVGADKCWDGYKAKGTKTKNGRQVPNCVKEEEEELEEKKGLYANIHAKRKRGESPAKPGDEDYPAKDAFKKAAKTAKEEYGKKKMEGMDPVGKEDGDVNNDGKKDSSDKYLMKRRKAIGKAMSMKKEEFSDWRSEMGLEEAKKCNATPEGTNCPEHGEECCPTVDEGCGCDGGSKKAKKY